jgi:hypothetical protein
VIWCRAAPASSSSTRPRTDDFIRISDREILTHAEKIPHETARLKAETEYDALRNARAALPQPVDRHFAESLDELKKIAGSARARRKPRRKKGRTT